MNLIHLLILTVAMSLFYAGCRLLVTDRFLEIKSLHLNEQIVEEVFIDSSETISYLLRQDYYIECAGNELVNITPLGEPIFVEQDLKEIKCV